LEQEPGLELVTAQNAARDRYDGPFLILDTSIVQEKLRRFIRAMPRVQPHYAMKANPHPRVIETIRDEGAGFEIASIAELNALLAAGVEPRKILYSNPVKARADVECAARRGVEWYVADCIEEIGKIVSVAPRARICLRIEVPNAGSDWPLSGKFGATIGEARDIVLAAARLGADLAGVMFHVGSQCRNPENWRAGLQRARLVFDLALAAGLNPRLVDIGGGFPVQLAKPIPSIETIGEVVNASLDAFPAGVGIVGTCRRGGKRWMYWDAGKFGGLLEATEGVKFQILTERIGARVQWQIGGPTCDSIDIVLRNEKLPGNLREGDFIYLRNAGAYTTAYASQFNGFPLPEVRVSSGGLSGSDRRRSD
jgi:ornithine decarboxylase